MLKIDKIYIAASQKRFNIVPFHKKEESQEKEEARLSSEPGFFSIYFKVFTDYSATTSNGISTETSLCSLTIAL